MGEIQTVKKLMQENRKLKRELKAREIAVYVEGGLVAGVLIVNKSKSRASWDTPEYSIIDFDTEGGDSESICTGCLYSDDPHYADYCMREQAKEAK